MPPVSLEHDDIRRFLESILDLYARERDLGHVHGESVVMRLSERPSGRCPDVHFVRKDRLDIERLAHIEGPVDLAIEIVSPDSRSQDRGEKFYEYEEGGVREYWLIDPERRQAEFYTRGEDGYFRMTPPGDDGRFFSLVVDGLWLEVAWLWASPRPSVLEVARVWGLV